MLKLTGARAENRLAMQTTENDRQQIATWCVLDRMRHMARDSSFLRAQVADSEEQNHALHVQLVVSQEQNQALYTHLVGSLEQNQTLQNEVELLRADAARLAAQLLNGLAQPHVPARPGVPSDLLVLDAAWQSP